MEEEMLGSGAATPGSCRRRMGSEGRSPTLLVHGLWWRSDSATVGKRTVELLLVAGRHEN
jgi:hypothetical protein